MLGIEVFSYGLRTNEAMTANSDAETNRQALAVVQGMVDHSVQAAVGPVTKSSGQQSRTFRQEQLKVSTRGIERSRTAGQMGQRSEGPQAEQPLESVSGTPQVEQPRESERPSAQLPPSRYACLPAGRRPTLAGRPEPTSTRASTSNADPRRRPLQPGRASPGAAGYNAGGGAAAGNGRGAVVVGHTSPPILMKVDLAGVSS